MQTTEVKWNGSEKGNQEENGRAGEGSTSKEEKYRHFLYSGHWHAFPQV